jgi:uncharacterized heparinase superfamily protein
MTGAQSFRFLNEDGTLTEGWDNPARAKLWRYNLHYFDDLNAENAADRRTWHIDLVERWIAENIPGQGTGWEPYPTSLRIVNWVKWALAGNALSAAATQSLAVQTRWLMRRLEWHILGNHLFANAKALIFAGLYFKGVEAEDWLAKGSNILLEQLPEQILADGGQFELSPMYHALAVEDVLDLVNITGVCPATNAVLREACARYLPRMLDWFAVMRHPDGEIAFFNDAAIGISPSSEEMEAYANRLGFAAPKRPNGPVFLESSGYARLEAGDALLLADVAQVGPDYLPGHAHADTLSFELSLGDQRVIVNSGTSVYGTDAERLRQRGTAAHSTVSLNGQNSSEVWSGFRVGRRSHASMQQFSGNTLVGTHDGYTPHVHRREWRLSSQALLVTDHLGDVATGAAARYHLHPDISIAANGDRAGTMQLRDGSTVIWETDGGAVQIEAGSWHPEFGLSVPNKVLVVPLTGGRAMLTLRWG